MYAYEVTKTYECLQSGLFLAAFFFFFFFLSLLTEVVFIGFSVCLETLLFMLPEDGIICKPAAITGSMLKSEEPVVASHAGHCMVLVPKQPDQEADHSHHDHS